MHTHPSPQPTQTFHEPPAQLNDDSQSTTHHGSHIDDNADISVDDSRDAPFILPPSIVTERKPRRRARTVRQRGAATGRGNGDHHAANDSHPSDDDEEEEDVICWINRLPSESLTRIFAHLDPLSLSRCALVSHSWSQVARDEATWRSAFASNYGTAISLRRVSKSSWKSEYIRRTDLLRRWRKSRSPAITSDMRVSNITSIAFSQAHNFMLCTSAAYGIASRADPFKGKVARGFVDAAGVLNGAGIGNPNAEFSPDVTALDAALDASRLAWGFRDGTVALTMLTRQGSNPRGMVRSVRFSLRGAHAGPVNAMAFDLNKPGQERAQKRRAGLDEDVAETLITGGEDGVVKLWTPLRAVPLWSSPIPMGGSSPAVAKVDWDADRGVIVAGTRDGKIVVWTGVDARALLAISSHAWDDEMSPELRSSSINDARVELAAQHGNIVRKDIVLPGEAAPINQLFLDAVGGSILAHKEQEACLFHVGLEDTLNLTILLPVGSEISAGKITCMRADCTATETPTTAPPSPPSVSANTLGPAPGSQRNLSIGEFAERRFVLAGTDDGKLLAWHLPSGPSPPSSISPSFALLAHHTPLTTLDLSPHLVAVGCSDGTIKAFDSLTGQLIRTWNDRTATRHPARMLAAGELTQDEAARFFVRQIVVSEESLVAAVGPHVLAWRAEQGVGASKRRAEGRDRGSAAALSTPSPNGAGPGTPGGASRSSRSSGTGLPPLSKYAQMREIKNELAESSSLLAAEREKRSAAYERLRFARGPAETGGLTEQEALEYAMMLSRDEEEARQAGTAQEGSQLSELARIRKEEVELQQALEQIELAEAGTGVGDESCFSSSQVSSSRVSVNEEEEQDDDGDDDAYHTRRYEHAPSSSPLPSPALSASSPRAWNIFHTNGAAPSASPSTSRWGDATKVRTVQVPRSARSSSFGFGAAGGSSTPGGPPPPSSLQSPEQWPSMLSLSVSPNNRQGSSSHVGSPLRLDASPSPSRPGSVSGQDNKGKAPVNGGGYFAARATGTPSSPPSISCSGSAWTGPKAGGAWASGTTPAWRRSPSVSASAVTASRTRATEQDEELRFAIELSLAEERSRLASLDIEARDKEEVGMDSHLSQ
ncbi:WD40 repeat-like protein [Jaminaea rosea]|uniref:WD40 repeat-like protein n=1 Tax=Jaminaea rosea TaxID=1569628 RepID=A0A316UM08_9BASI|nr:WD40 repeat-like protein [Jaminaea rosea]PWN26297.1 WD40 repeat-like protein [Jaminaea rosea]